MRQSHYIKCPHLDSCHLFLHLALRVSLCIEHPVFCFTAALTFKCLGDQWPVYCRVIREKNLCQDMRWYQRCCETCRDFYAQKLQRKS